MSTLMNLLANAEFWMGISLLSAALPGPQTRILPALFRTLARVMPQVIGANTSKKEGK